MKNKLYFGLFPAYVIVVVLVLFLNGVFTGGPIDGANLAINGITLLVIGVLFLFSTISFGKLNHFTDELIKVAEKMQKEYKDASGRSLWNEYQDKKDLFKSEALKMAYTKFRMRMKNFKTARGYVDSCDIEEYINDDLMERVSNSHFNGAMAGTLTGLGILGTFLGLSIGLGSFNGNDIYAVTDNVGTLLGGMKVAFHTSVYGIFFSLIFGFVYRSIMADAYEKMEIFLHVFRQCVVPPVMKEEESNSAMLIYQANTANYMKEMLNLMQGQAQVQIAGIEQIVTKCMDQLSSAMGNTLSKLGATLQANATAQQTYVQSSRALLEDANALLEYSKKNQETLMQITQRQVALENEINMQKELLQSACAEMSQDISNQLYTFDQMRNMYEK